MEDNRQPDRDMPGAETGNAIHGCIVGVGGLLLLAGAVWLLTLAAKILPHEQPDFPPPPASTPNNCPE